MSLSERILDLVEWRRVWGLDTFVHDLLTLAPDVGPHLDQMRRRGELRVYGQLVEVSTPRRHPVCARCDHRRHHHVKGRCFVVGCRCRQFTE